MGQCETSNFSASWFEWKSVQNDDITLRLLYCIDIHTNRERAIMGRLGLVMAAASSFQLREKMSKKGERSFV